MDALPTEGGEPPVTTPSELSRDLQQALDGIVDVKVVQVGTKNRAEKTLSVAAAAHPMKVTVVEVPMPTTAVERKAALEQREEAVPRLRLPEIAHTLERRDEGVLRLLERSVGIDRSGRRGVPRSRRGLLLGGLRFSGLGRNQTHECGFGRGDPGQTLY